MSKRTGEVEDPISQMGCERMVLRARGVTLFLLTFFSFTCLGLSLRVSTVLRT